MPDDARRTGAVDDPAAFAELLDASSPEVRAIIEALDALVRRTYPDVVQVVWTHQRTVGYGVGPKKQSEHYAYLDVYARHVNLGFNQGALLADPHGLLTGTGAQFRSMRVTDRSQATDSRLADLLRDADASGWTRPAGRSCTPAEPGRAGVDDSAEDCCISAAFAKHPW